jgi:cytochrome P450
MTLGEEFARWGHDYFMLTTGAPPLSAEEELQLAARAQRMTAWLRQYVQQCQDNPGDDLISALLCATTEEGDPALTYDEVVGVLNSTMVAGVETTAVFVPALVAELLKEPHQWKLLREGRSLRAQAIEEGLRYLCPARGVRRTTTRAVELGGVTLPAGVDVFVGYVSANFDEAIFDDAGHFDLHRPNADRHLSFGKGPHFCIGAAVARLEARVALDALLERIPELRLADDHVDEWIPHMTLPRRTAVRVAW